MSTCCVNPWMVMSQELRVHEFEHSSNILCSYEVHHRLILADSGIGAKGIWGFLKQRLAVNGILF